jgi:hypothetical protein
MEADTGQDLGRTAFSKGNVKSGKQLRMTNKHVKDEWVTANMLEQSMPPKSTARAHQRHKSSLFIPVSGVRAKRPIATNICIKTKVKGQWRRTVHCLFNKFIKRDMVIQKRTIKSMPAPSVFPSKRPRVM